MDARVRITVLRRSQNLDFLEQWSDSIWDPCERLQEGQVFVSYRANIPPGFCSWAWGDIQKYVMTLARGGNFLGVKEGTFVTCCTDGFRPVFFLVERMHDDEPDPIQFGIRREEARYDIDRTKWGDAQ